MVKATGGTSNQIYYPVLSKCQKETHCKKRLHMLHTCSASHIFVQHGQRASSILGSHLSL